MAGSSTDSQRLGAAQHQGHDPYFGHAPGFHAVRPLGFGYMWWVWDGPFASGPYEGAYAASGAHGQWITVLPKLDTVVVHKASWSSTGGPRHSVDRPSYFRLLDLLTEKQPASKEELRKWKECKVN